MSASVSLKVVAPSLIVSDVAASVEFFKEKLGFEVMFVFGEPVEYGAMVRDEVQIHVSKDYAGGRVGKGACYVSVTGVDALYEELKGRGVTIAEDIATRHYGMRDFFVADLDGNTIGFGGQATEGE